MRQIALFTILLVAALYGNAQHEKFDDKLPRYTFNFEDLKTGGMDTTSIPAAENDNTDALLPKLDSLTEVTRPTKAHGYRILVISANRPISADKVSMVRNLVDNAAIYKKYDAPTYKILEGNYISKVEALKSLAKLKLEFQSALIIETNVDL